MKRIGNLYEEIISMENLVLADKKARKGKMNQYGVKVHIQNAERNLEALHLQLKNKTFKTSEYSIFKVYEPKEREVYRLPYFPDRIVHHAIMNKLEPIFVSSFTKDTYSCIKGRGIHAGFRAIKECLKDVPGTKYCLKLDITKFYPGVDHDILKELLKKKIKDPNLIWLLDEIIDSASGLPIGNYLSQFLSNFYLTYFDNWVKRVLGVKNYFRYADDMVIFDSCKERLHHYLAQIKTYLSEKLKLVVKGTYQVFLLSARGCDMLGYRFYHSHIMLRKGIKQRFARMLSKRRNPASIASYFGWCKHANTKHLLKKLLNGNEIQRFGNKTKYIPLHREINYN